MSLFITDIVKHTITQKRAEKISQILNISLLEAANLVILKPNSDEETFRKLLNFAYRLRFPEATNEVLERAVNLLYSEVLASSNPYELVAQFAEELRLQAQKERNIKIPRKVLRYIL